VKFDVYGFFIVVTSPPVGGRILWWACLPARTYLKNHTPKLRRISCSRYGHCSVLRRCDTLCILWDVDIKLHLCCQVRYFKCTPRLTDRQTDRQSDGSTPECEIRHRHHFWLSDEQDSVPSATVPSQWSAVASGTLFLIPSPLLHLSVSSGHASNHTCLNGHSRLTVTDTYLQCLHRTVV